MVVAARPMLSAAVIRLRPKRAFNCRLVLFLILTSHSRNNGIKAVEMSHTHERAVQISITVKIFSTNALPSRLFIPALT